MSAIPYRIWYKPKEAAQLTGMSEDYVCEALVKGRRRNPPDGAILPHQQRKFGAATRIHRSWIYPDEPANVTPLHGGITDAQLDAAAHRLFDTILARLTELRSTQPQKRSA